MGMSFNRTLWKLTGRQIGREARALMNAGNGYSTFWAPVVNLAREPRWGRNIETPGEDPFLTGQYAKYPVVIINWVQYLGPPGPFSFPDSRDLLEVLRDFLGRERGGGPQGILPDPRGSSLGVSLSAKEVLREPREGPENLGRRRVPEVRDTEPN